MRTFIALFGLALFLGPNADGLAETYVEGQHYQRLEQPVRTADPGRIEVAEVFSYSCGHCFAFEPLLQAWERKLPRDTVVVQTHAMWNPQMESLIRGYYTSLALGIKDKTHMPVFNAIHLEHKNFGTAESWADFFAQHGVDKAKAISTYNSFGVTSQIKQAEARARGYKVTGTPELVVNGQYRVSADLAGGHEQMLKVADYLINQVRQERAKAPAR